MEERIPLSITADQLGLEREMATRGVERYHSTVSKAMEKGRLSLTAPGRQLVSEANADLAQAIEAWREDAEGKSGARVGALANMEGMAGHDLAAITLQAMLDASTIGEKRNTCICRIAGLVRDERLLQALRREHGPLFERLHSAQVPRHMRTTAAHRWLEQGIWSYEEPLRTHQIQVGLVLFELALDAAPLFLVDGYKRDGKDVVLVKLRGGVQDWIERSHEAHEALRPVYLPMVQEPGKWGPDSLGGYRSHMARRKPLCRVQRRRHLEEVRQAEMPQVYRAVNLAQETQWRVNATVYEVARELWNSNAKVAGLPDREEPELPERPDSEDEEELKAWKSLKCDLLERFRLEGSSRLRHLRTLELARKFAGKTIWLPHFLDFRGRMYPVPPWLNHQGPDFARGLLEFSRSSRVEHGSPEAELFEEHGRELWKGDIPEGLVEAVHQDPLDCLAWTGAKKPWQFLAWALDAAEWRADEGHPIRVPVSADGSNNGLQIYSLLMRDPELARATNVSPGPKADLYQAVADRVWERVQRDPGDLARQWRAFLPDGLPRDATKRPVMTAPYGIRKHSLVGYLRQWLLELQRERGERPWGHSTFKPCYWLGGIIWAEMWSLIEPAERCMKWLRSVANACDSVRWTNPVGFPTRQDYPKRPKVTIKVVISDVPRRVGARRTLEATDPAKQRDGLPPNYVHSLDSAALVATMNRAADAGIQDFAMVHDSYGCPAGDAVRMGELLRESFAEIFAEPLLEQFAAEVAHYAPEATIPSPPELGDLDPAVVLDSRHFFA